MRYRFEDAVLDTATFELSVGDAVTPVEPQVFEVLAYLVRHRDRLVPRTELLDAIWGDRFVSDSALASRVAAARAAIGDDGRTQRCIRTVHGRGLQFVAPVIVELGAEQEDAPEPADDLRQSVRFAHAPDGLQLAVATVGQGAPLVKAANWLTHVELDWRSPVWRHWNDALAARFRYIRYDARGCGLSDRDLSGSDLTNLDVWVDDLAAVVEASDVERFALLGISQGAAPAMAYAVRHPERISHLILYGAYLRGMRRRDEATRQRAEMFLTLMRDGWGGSNPAFRSVFTTTFMPDASSEQMRWFNDLQVKTADSANAMQLEAAFYDHDFTELADAVTVPTVVFHSRGDLATPYEEGRALASRIPGAELVTLDSRNHILVESEPAWKEFLRHLDRFAGR